MMLRKYETLFVVKPELTEDALEAIRTRLTSSVEKNGGIEITYQDWGKRRLAYSIRKYPKGQYLYFRYLGLGPAVFELERQMKVMDDVLRFMTQKLEDRVDSETFDAEADRQGIYPFNIRPREYGDGDRREEHRGEAEGDDASKEGKPSDSEDEAASRDGEEGSDGDE